MSRGLVNLGRHQLRWVGSVPCSLLLSSRLPWIFLAARAKSQATSWALESELSDHHFYHILLTKAKHKTSPDLQDMETDSISWSERLHHLVAKCVNTGRSRELGGIFANSTPRCQLLYMTSLELTHKSWMCKSQTIHLHIKRHLAFKEPNSIIRCQMRAHVLDTVFDNVFPGFRLYSWLSFPPFKAEQSQVTTWTPKGM